MAQRYNRTTTGHLLYMTDSELITSYNQAKDQVGQIKILAELNAMPEYDMQQYLIYIGALRPAIARRNTINKPRVKHILHNTKPKNIEGE